MPMMQSLILNGKAESGYGVTIVGFHDEVGKFNARLEELKSQVDPIHNIETFEYNGYATCLISSQEKFSREKPQVAIFRREPHKFFQDLPKFLSSTKAAVIDNMILSGSLGSISLTLLYRPCEGVDG